MREYKWEDFTDEMKAMYHILWPGLTDEDIIRRINMKVFTEEEAKELAKAIDEDFRKMSEEGLKSLKEDTSIIENAVKMNEKSESCCDRYDKGMSEIINQNVFCYGREAAPKYTSGAFRYCPYCGTKVKWETIDFITTDEDRKNGKGTLIETLEGEI